MTDAALFVLLSIAAGIAGAVVHELSHWTVATALGRDAYIDWRTMDTVWTVDIVKFRDCVAGLAPQTLGVAAAIFAFASSTTVPVWLVPGWVLLTLTGAREDWTLATRLGETAKN